MRPTPARRAVDGRARRWPPSTSATGSAAPRPTTTAIRLPHPAPGIQACTAVRVSVLSWRGPGLPVLGGDPLGYDHGPGIDDELTHLFVVDGGQSHLHPVVAKV